MKKTYCIFTLFAALLFASTSFAAGVSKDSTAGQLQIVCTDTTKPTLTMGLSTKVHARYVTSDTPAQWYTIGTYHEGGTKVYATAQDVTKILQKSLYGSCEGNESTAFTGLPTQSQSESQWSGGVWNALLGVYSRVTPRNARPLLRGAFFHSSCLSFSR